MGKSCAEPTGAASLGAGAAGHASEAAAWEGTWISSGGSEVTQSHVHPSEPGVAKFCVDEEGGRRDEG